MNALPSETLDAPYPELLIPSGVQDMLHWTDYLSVSHDVLLAIQFLTGFNPVTSFTEWFGGDWRSFGVVASSVTQMQEYTGALAAELHGSADALDAAWSGQAAGAAVTFFDESALTVLDLNGPLADIEQSMQEMAQAVQTGTALISGFIETAIDQVIVMLIEAAAGAVLIETVVGAAAAWSLAVVQAKAVIDTIKQLIKAWRAMMTAIDVVTGIIIGAAGILDSKAAPLALTPYQHPGVTR